MSYALGIDLGTTFTAAAVSRNGRVEIVGMGNHSSSIPSAVLLREDGELLVGDAATRRGQQEPARLAREFKRRLGDATPIIFGPDQFAAAAAAPTFNDPVEPQQDFIQPEPEPDVVDSLFNGASGDDYSNA